MKRVVRKTTLALIISICASSCWPIGLMIQDAFHVVEELETSSEVFPEAIQGDLYREAVSLHSPEFIADPWVRLTSGSLPRGLEISVENKASKEGVDRYELVLKGVPEEAGTFTFRVRVDCCMTMSGASMRSSARFKIRVRDLDK